MRKSVIVALQAVFDNWERIKACMTEVGQSQGLAVPHDWLAG